jgi:capsular polysaccharide biosynthesis protein
MELSDYFRILRQRGWLIIVLAALTAGAAFGFSKLQVPVYKSSVKLLVSPSRTDFGQAQAAKTLLRGYESWMLSSLRAQRVIEELKMDMTPNQLLGDVAVASDDSRFIIQFDVENTNGDVANDIARTWGNLLIQRQDDINATLRKEDRIGIEFIDMPQYGLDRPRTTINTAAGAVFGALLGIVVIFALEWIESGVMRRRIDVERYLEVPVVGTIPARD